MGKRKNKSRGLSAETADRHSLYQESVQCPEHEVELLTRLFKRHTGRPPVTLREDFCGTALLCAEWIHSDPARSATGIDLDADVLSWGHKHNLAPMGTDGARVTLLQRDVTAPLPGSFDVVVGFNYSYSVFKTREALRGYFEAARSALGPEGLFVIDAWGGWESQQPLVERRKQDGFFYVWDQSRYDPITSYALNHIHFEFPDGTRLKRAFTYDWRFWSLAELQELLREAGFVDVDVLWEDADDRGEGTGVFRSVKSVDNDPGWNAYLVAKTCPPLPGSKDAKKAEKRARKLAAAAAAEATPSETKRAKKAPAKKAKKAPAKKAPAKKAPAKKAKKAPATKAKKAPANKATQASTRKANEAPAKRRAPKKR